jgi:FO synthase
MRNEPACPTDEYLWTIAAARVLLPKDIHLQAPPNLSDDIGQLIDAGIDDWGGVSPVTSDHVNPERPWPELDRLRAITEERGYVLAPRLTAHPEYVLNPSHWKSSSPRMTLSPCSLHEGQKSMRLQKWLTTSATKRSATP